MNLFHAQASYLFVVIITLVCILLLLYSLVRYHKRLNIWTFLFLIFLIINLALLLFGKTIKEYNIFLSFKPAVDTLMIMSSILWFIALMKGSLRRTWESVTGRKLLIFCGVGMLISIVLIATGFFQEKFG